MRFFTLYATLLVEEGVANGVAEFVIPIILIAVLVSVERDLKFPHLLFVVDEGRRLGYYLIGRFVDRRRSLL